MSTWQDKIDNVKFTITTGDGKEFFPLWKGASKETPLNTTSFEFIDVPGSLVERKKPMGSKYPLAFWFQGYNNVEQANDFEVSSFDNRVWTVSHPFYGTIKGQPTSISRNDDAFNITAFTVEFLESIDVDYPNANFSVKDNTLLKQNAVMAAAADSFASCDSLAPEDIVKIKDSNVQTSSAFRELQTDETYPVFQNKFASAQKALDDLLPSPLNAILKTQALLNDSTDYELPVLVRLGAYLKAFYKIKDQLLTLADKYFYESQGATAIASYANAAANPIEGDYAIAPDVVSASTKLLEMYDLYQTKINEAAVSIYDTGNTWQPDATLQLELEGLVRYSVANLYLLAFDAQQERVVYTDKDTNLILLTHRYLGLDVSDDNLAMFRKVNGITLNELLKIKKGRKIIYYV